MTNNRDAVENFISIDYSVVERIIFPNLSDIFTIVQYFLIYNFMLLWKQPQFSCWSNALESNQS